MKLRRTPEDVDRFAVVDRRNKYGPIETAHEFALEQGRVGRLAIGPRIHDLAGLADGTTEVERPVLLPIANQAGCIDAIDDRVRPETEKRRAVLGQLR